MTTFVPDQVKMIRATFSKLFSTIQSSYSTSSSWHLTGKKSSIGSKDKMGPIHQITQLGSHVESCVLLYVGCNHLLRNACAGPGKTRESVVALKVCFISIQLNHHHQLLFFCLQYLVQWKSWCTSRFVSSDQYGLYHE